MIVSAMVKECDFTDRKYDEYVRGGWFLSRGATGRWCVVMHGGPEFLEENGYTTITADEAHEAIACKGGDDWGDF